MPSHIIPDMWTPVDKVVDIFRHLAEDPQPKSEKAIMIVGVDFGTTYSGMYAFLSSF